MLPRSLLQKRWLNAIRRIDLGTLHFVDLAGELHVVTGSRPGPTAHFSLKDWDVIAQLVARGDIGAADGERYWPRYFQTLSERLKRGGRAVLQSITVRDDIFPAYRRRSDFIRQYVFPGGMLPSLSSIREEAERAGLRMIDVFPFGSDYARTLRAWGERQRAARPEILALGHDDRFMRNWQFYLGMCAAAFAVGRTDVVQAEFAHA